LYGALSASVEADSWKDRLASITQQVLSQEAFRQALKRVSLCRSGIGSSYHEFKWPLMIGGHILQCCGCVNDVLNDEKHLSQPALTLSL
tara:strand:- start:90039 stop:90305 length:267 start_codon:yes stop_codon:yes gene_type:complete